MKQKVILFFFTTFFFFMLLFPKNAFLGASTGLLLWFNTVLPSLLPCLILSNLLIETNAFLFLSRIFAPAFQKLFHISKSSCYAVFIGFFCGYPMGAKVISDITKKGHISSSEGQYLLSFCNNTSPMFILNYIVCQSFGQEQLAFKTMLILILSPILCSQIFYLIYKSQFTVSDHCLESKITFPTSALDDCIVNALLVLARVGGYIILFSVIQSLSKPFLNNLIISFLEITTGIAIIVETPIPFQMIYILVLALSSFGGCCAIFQTYSMIQETFLSIKPYIIQKLITAIVTSFLAIFLFCIN